ncbi:hypothetical protein PCH_Pc22g17500 [Penicillium rubens Wisconsin 54-1255]|uniref:Uncharacterized protein n=1 Tax=Penicillium rubens (strain ATCC 28089 / DSM 1075 / NRRL 1951 / Wisconsin 54-1255) TaxID=500485 RepID=B6HSV5_PENRW|nr:hypothetical protein PCH_Pc22g17500 [Penicillium rubens Wisconsin 54-1255]
MYTQFGYSLVLNLLSLELSKSHNATYRLIQLTGQPASHTVCLSHLDITYSTDQLPLHMTRLVDKRSSGKVVSLHISDLFNMFTEVKKPDPHPGNHFSRIFVAVNDYPSGDILLGSKLALWGQLPRQDQGSVLDT